MLHTPLKHAHPPTVPPHGHVHAPAQHAQTASTRCSPHSVHGSHTAFQPHTHELNIADWLHMSPAQVAMMSPAVAPYTPPNHLFVPSPSPLQYAPAPNGRNDFLTTSPLPYSSPFQLSGAPYPHLNPYSKTPEAQQMQVPSICVSVEGSHKMMEARSGNNMSPGPTDANLLLSLSSVYFPYTTGSGADSSAAASPVEHGGSSFPFQGYMGPTGEGESTPVTTLSSADESQAKLQLSSQVDRPMQPFIERLREASPDTQISSSVSHSPVKSQNKPVESAESPFCIAAPQPRAGSGLVSPLPPSSRPSTGLGALSELAELASQRSTPLGHSYVPPSATHSRPCSQPTSRPASALSSRSTTSHVKTPKCQRRKLLPHRFAPSPLRVHLHYQMLASGSDAHTSSRQLSPSLVDGLPRGPLEFEDEGHRYRTRSKLRSLKAEIQEREREADLVLIRRGLRGETTLSSVDAQGKGGLEMLASVSVTRRIELDSPKRSETPASSDKENHKMVRPKRGMKRAFKDLDDGEYDSATDDSVNGARTPSKRSRTATEKATASARIKTEPSSSVPVRAHTKRSSRGRAPARPLPARISSTQQVKKDASSKSSTLPVSKKAISGRKMVEMGVDESELSSLSGMSETEDAKSSSADDTDYAPKKNSRNRTKSSHTSVSKAGSAKSASKTPAPVRAKGTPIDTAGGVAAIDVPVRTFPPEVPVHAGFPLFYRKFPVCGYTDPNAFSFASFDSSPLSSAKSSSGNGKAEGADDMPPPPSTGHFNAPRSAEDLYTPRFVKGVGRDKMGLCPVCYESPERGGSGRAEWLSMKFSAFNYHMQYAHGISPITALPFSPPIAFRTVSRTPNHKNEKSEILEGKCHRCQEWAPVEGVKCVEAKLKEIYWWKHAAACHKGSNISGERDTHLEDAVSRRVKSVFDTLNARVNPAVPALPKFLTH